MNRHAIPDIDLRNRLALEHGLECHLLMSNRNQQSPAFPTSLCAELSPLLQSAYGLTPTPAHFQHETWAVTLRSPNCAPVACLTLGFRSSFPSYFSARFEAVEPSRQRQGLGRLLFECAAVWARFLVLNDPLAMHGVLQSDGDYCLVAFIDADPDFEDNQATHGRFLRKLGFVRAQHDFGQTEDEIAFQRAYHVPLEREDEDD